MNGWVQASAVAVTVIGGVWYLSIDIEGVRHDSMHQIDALSARLSADEEKITAIKDLEAGHFAEEVAKGATIQNTLNSIATSLADLRVETAKRDRGK